MQTRSEMQSQIDTLTGRARSAEARVAELETERDCYRAALETAHTYRTEMPPTCWVVIDGALNR